MQADGTISEVQSNAEIKDTKGADGKLKETQKDQIMNI